MNLTKSFDFDEVDNYSYDNQLIEVINSSAKLKAVVSGAEAYAYWTMDDNTSDEVFRDVSGNSRDGAFKGGYTGNNKVPGKINNGLQGISTSQGFVGLGTIDFNFEKTDALSLELWINTTSTNTMGLLLKQNNVSPFDGYGMTIINGIVRGIFRDELGNALVLENNTPVNDGSWHHVVLTYDGSNDISGIHLYVDNTENDVIVASTALSGTMINNIDFQISGRNGNNNCIDNLTILDEAVVYDRALTQAEISFRWNNGDGTQEIPGQDTSFATNNPIITPFGATKLTQFLDINYTTSISGNDEIKIINIIDENKYWYNGSAWVESNGDYLESNTLAEMETNILGLNAIFEDATNWNMELFLHSDDGTTTPEISLFELVFNSEEVEPVPTGLITVDEIRDLLEGYCIDNTIVSDSFIASRRDKYVIPVIIEDRLGISVSGDLEKEVYLNGTGKSILILPDKNILELVNIQYVNTQSVYSPSLANFELITREGILKAKYNFNESFIDPVFPKGTRNIKITYKVGYNELDIPDSVNELIGYLTVIEILTWIEGRSGGGNVSAQNFNRDYGSLGKYTNIRRQLTQRCNVMIRNIRSYVI